MGWWGRTETVGKGRAASESVERALPAHLAAMLARLERTAEEDIALARWLIKHGDFAAALRHLAPPIAADPEKLEWLEVIDDWIATAGPDAIDHFPPEGECSVGENILRAYVLAAREEFLPALAALQAVQTADPQARCLDVWGLAWLDSDKVLRSIPRQQLDDMLAQIPVRYPEFRELRAAEREPLLRLLRVLQRFAKLCEPNAAELILRSQCLRKVGQYDEAYNLARQVYLQEPGYASSVTLAMVLRVGGHTQKAVNAFQVALRHRPHDVPVLIELGDIQFDAERWQDAAHWYEWP
jgi:tetratricopeptide (TPR) repeat protein